MPFYLYAGIEYQNFEEGNSQSGWGFNSAVAAPSGLDGPVHSGDWSWKVVSSGYYGGTGIKAETNEWHFDMQIDKNDRLSFWIYALPANNTDNNVCVQFFDHGAYHQTGFEVWTTKMARYGEWTELTVLFSQLPNNLNLNDIDKIQFINYRPGTYYIDDICAIRRDRVYQSFEPGIADTGYEYGWKWDAGDEVGLSGEGEPVHSGLYSWKLTAEGKWSGTGIKSQEKKLVNNQQDFWHVDLNPEMNDRLVFWVYSLADNGFDNNIGVQFYDHGNHNTDDTKVEMWTRHAAVYGKWTRLTVLFSELLELQPDLNLKDINKIQFQVYWSGIYYFDDIMAAGPVLGINKMRLGDDLIQWNDVDSAYRYEIEMSENSQEGPWNPMTVLVGDFNWAAEIQKYKPVWLRIRWQEENTGQNTIPYVSDWSDPVQYRPPLLLIDRAELGQGRLKWTNYEEEWHYLHAPLQYYYKVETAETKDGPWEEIYYGMYPEDPIIAQEERWYRVKAISCLENTEEAADESDWCTPQLCRIQGGFIKAVGTILKEDDGEGDEIVLRGVNLGGWQIIEAWMTGIGIGRTDDPADDMDDWSIRELLERRFGYNEMESILSAYRNAYLSTLDFDILHEIGINFVRLPVYYKNFEDENGNWIIDTDGEMDFSEIDNIVNLCADRNIYVLLDLHGAPGCQSPMDHSGRADYNKLFEDSREGQEYRNKTIEFWTRLAQHYRNNRNIVGYDLLNEPTGAGDDYNRLWDFYDELYNAIRAVDQNHIIVMEGIWDWDTLPDPRWFNWENVVYEFHYYNFGFDEDLDAHKDFLDQKILANITKQEEYNIPIMIGEFSGMSLRNTWGYYMQNFNLHRWSWAFWTYKYQFSPSQWGLYLNADYNDELDLNNDSLETIRLKIDKYDTRGYHLPNESLVGLIKQYTVQDDTVLMHPPVLQWIGDKTLNEGEILQFIVTADDADEDELVFTVSSLPNGAEFNSVTKEFQWLPDFAQAGIYYVTFIVSDGICEDSETIAINVRDILPPAPRNLTYNYKLIARTLLLKWECTPHKYLLGYEVFTSTDNNKFTKWVKIHKGLITQTSYEVKISKSINSRHKFKVRAVYLPWEYSLFSNTVQVGISGDLE